MFKFTISQLKSTEGPVLAPSQAVGKGTQLASSYFWKQPSSLGFQLQTSSSSIFTTPIALCSKLSPWSAGLLPQPFLSSGCVQILSSYGTTIQVSLDTFKLNYLFRSLQRSVSKLSKTMHTYHCRTLELKAGGSELQDHPQLHRKLWPSSATQSPVSSIVQWCYYLGCNQQLTSWTKGSPRRQEFMPGQLHLLKEAIDRLQTLKDSLLLSVLKRTFILYM